LAPPRPKVAVYMLVVVALVEVEFRAVKFWRVEEALTLRLERVVKPLVMVTVPVKLAAFEMVWPLIRPEVIGPAVRVPMLPVVAKRFVVVAVKNVPLFE
jgi:hypothetical protein